MVGLIPIIQVSESNLSGLANMILYHRCLEVLLEPLKTDPSKKIYLK
jgi:hypothetical protein